MTERATLTYLYDVFVSYNDADQSWIERELVPRLHEARVRYIDQSQFNPGQPILNQIAHAVVNSRWTLLIITPEYLDSSWRMFDALLASSYGLDVGEWRVLPAIMRACQALPIPLDALVKIPLDHIDEARWQRLIQKLREPGNGGVSPAPAPVSRKAISNGLRALTELMQVDGVHEAVVTFRTTFEAACERIDILAAYKRLHDFFQRLENGYALLFLDGKRVMTDASAWESIECIAPEVLADIDELLRFAGGCVVATDETVWMRKLTRAQQELQASVERYDVDQFKSAIRRLNELLGREPSRINDRLIATADALRLLALVKAMTTICDNLNRMQLADMAQRQVEVFRTGVAALARLHERVTTLVDDHNLLQRIDDELRRIEAQLEHDMSELKDAWIDLKLMMDDRSAQRSVDWTIKLQTIGAELEEALTIDTPTKVKRLFRSYRSQASRSFNQVDRDLLVLCEELQQVGQPLAEVLRVVQDD